MIPHLVGVPPDVDDVAVVHQPVDEGGCHDFVAEYAAPVLEALDGHHITLTGESRRKLLKPPPIDGSAAPGGPRPTR